MSLPLPDRITAGCPVRTTLEMLGGKWSLLVLHQLAEGACRFGELRQWMPDISEKVLVQELKRLLLAGLIKTTPAADAPARAAYYLTGLGREGLLVLDAVTQFGFVYAAHIQARRPDTSPPAAVAGDEKTLGNDL